MADGMDGLDRWLRQRLAATLDDAARAPRRRLLLPGATTRGSHPRRDGFVAGVATTAVLFGVLWAAVAVGLHRSSPGPAEPSRAGRVVSSVAIPDPAYAVAAGEGGVWVPDDRAGTLLRIDPRSGRVVATISIGTGNPSRIDAFDAVATSPGAVWVTSSVDNALLRIDPSSNAVAQRIPLGVQPTSLAVLDADVWVTSSRANEVLRVSVATGVVEGSISVTDPSHVSVGSGGVWVGSEREGVLSRIDPATNRAATVYTGTASDDYVVDAVAAVDGGAWIRNLAAQSVEHVDMLTGVVIQRATVGGGGATLGITVANTVTSTDDAVWVSVSDALVRVDRRTLQVVRLPLIDPTGVVVAEDGTLWVATAQRTVLHVVAGSG